MARSQSASWTAGVLPTTLVLSLILLLLSPLTLAHSHSPIARHRSDRSLALPYAHAEIPRQDPDADQEEGRVVLPTSVRPIHYNITIEPHFQASNQSVIRGTNPYSFDGHAAIDIEVDQPTYDIVFNTKLLELLEVTLEQGSETLRPNLTQYSEDDEQTSLLFSEIIPVGHWALHIRYSGIVDANLLAGFYACPYERPDGTQDVYFATQFESADARRAFPSWDEPGVKADFSITLIAARRHTAISNMPVAHVEYLPGQRKAVHFETSPAMSTYLVAFAVGELDHFETSDFRVPIRVYVPPSQNKEDMRFAAETAAKGMWWYEKTFGVKYPLPKLDILSISLMNFGGMENWGLITIVHDWLPVTNRTTAAERKAVANVVLHELAHLWFGDLVTMEWWNDIWLNEGFAENLQSAAQMEIFPDWHMAEDFLVTELIPAQGVDGFLSSHALRPNITSGPESAGYFDGITYAKGASVVNMMRGWIGREPFYQGLHAYLLAHEYDNVETPDLWRALSEASGRDVAYYMDAWVNRPGFPVVEVDENTAAGTITLKQSRYLEAEALRPVDAGTVWPLFLMIRTHDDEGKDAVNRDVVMTLPEQAFQLAPRDLDFYLLNADYMGMWRVSYTTDRIWKLAGAISAGRLTQRDTIGLLSDTCTLAPSGQQSVSNCLEIVAAAAHRRASGYYVWAQIVASTDVVRAGFHFDEGIVGQLKGLLHDITADKAHELGWHIAENEPVVSELFKSFMFYQAGKWGDQAVIRAARDMFWALIHAAGGDGGDKKGGNSKREAGMYAEDVIDVVHPSLWKSVFCLGVRYGGDSAYMAIIDLIDRLIPPPVPSPPSSNSSSHSPPPPPKPPMSQIDHDFLDAAFSAQACTDSAYNALRTLNRAVAIAPRLRGSQSPWLVDSLLSTVKESPTVVQVTWDWMTKQGGWERLTGGEEPVVDPVFLVQSTALFLADRDAAGEVRAFFKDTLQGGGGDTTKRSVGVMGERQHRNVVGARMVSGVGMGMESDGGRDPGLKLAVEKVLAVLDQRSAWAERDGDALRRWLGDRRVVE